MDKRMNWLKSGLLALICALSLAGLTHLYSPAQAQSTPALPQWTPIIVSATPTTEAVMGVDGHYHGVYELILANTSPVTVTVNRIDLVDGESPDGSIASFTDDDLLLRLRTLGNVSAPSADLGPSETRLFLVDHSFARGSLLPQHLLHRLNISAPEGPGQTEPSSLSYTAAPLRISPAALVLGPPLRGPGWVAANGCCFPLVGHRSTGLPTNGELHFAQRFAIDWMQLDRQGRIAVGDLSEVGNYPGYGAELLAVADGTVIQTRSDLPEQVPPTLPDPSTINLENVLGNNVILGLGNGAYALYAHLQPGSVRVTPGESVKQGQVLGLLGNTGNTSAPHLHFHLMDGPTLASNGLPYTLDPMAIVGQIPLESVEQFYSLEGDWRSALLPQPEPREQQFPLFLTVVDFPE
ncbi:M23 family metallopeptidase [Leptolyngbya sp. CCNP1308]|uniref:M23 family metallopeptidase n=1 Tax=Leptolyngbya sp. CCNP1308 TaxID=3110255 RepID=UPI002B21DF55|nr:M23 family metallopeptidase [Leptolyngbya sp. CCNP1308]MEA5452868.1 M23 family metallopeptidase [Leptolyngbya sp. CCNP1308]